MNGGEIIKQVILYHIENFPDRDIEKKLTIKIFDDCNLADAFWRDNLEYKKIQECIIMYMHKDPLSI